MTDHPQLPAARALLASLRAAEQDADQLYDAAHQTELASRSLRDWSATALTVDIADDLAAVCRQAEALVDWIAAPPRIEGIIVDAE